MEFKFECDVKVIFMALLFSMDLSNILPFLSYNLIYQKQKKVIKQVKFS